MVLRNWLFILFTVCILYIPAQCDLVIKGQIIDLDDGSELSDCIVSIIGTQNNAFTDDHGRFKFAGLCSGTYSILVKHIGCKDTVLKVELRNELNLKLKLPHSAFELSEVDVMDKRLAMKQTQTVEQLNAKELQAKSGLALGEILKQVSGVTSLNTGASISKPMIHGMQGYRLLILNNGIRQEGQQWGNEHAPEIDPYIAKRMTVIKGSNSLRYGSDAIAGVILVEPNELPDTSALQGEVNLTGLSNGRLGSGSGMLEGSFDKLKNWSWRLQGSVKRGGNIHTPNYYLRNTGVEEYNFSAATGYHRKNWGAEVYYSQFNTRIGIFQGSHISNLTDLQMAYNRSKPLDSTAGFSYEIERPFQEISHELIKASAHYHLSTRWRAKMQYAWQYNWRKEYDLHLPKGEASQVLADGTPQVDYRITSQTGDLTIEHDNIRSFRGAFGASIMDQSNVYVGRFFIPFYKNLTYGVYAVERFVKQHYEIEAGVRYDQKHLQSFYYKNNVLQTPILNFSNLTYNGGLIWKPDTSFNIHVNLGSAWRAPAVNELYANGIHHGASSIERGSDQLNVEKVINASVSSVIKLNKLLAEVSLYHNHFKNYIYLDPSGLNELTIRGAFPVFNYKQTKARISGLDLKCSFQLPYHIQLLGKAMFVRGWDLNRNDHLVLMPGDRAELNIRYQMPEVRNLSDVFFQLNNVYVNKQWRVPANSDFAPPPMAYYLLGLETGATFKAGKQMVIAVFSITNALNTVYRDYLDRFRYYTDAQGVSYNLRITLPLNLYDKH